LLIIAFVPLNIPASWGLNTELWWWYLLLFFLAPNLHQKIPLQGHISLKL
jgi:hypothetical protein